jgi:TolA-binding protein
MTHEDCPTDLLAKERREELSALERRTLQLHLVRCKTCRAWRQIGRDFDDETTAAIDDGAVLQRIADGVRCASTSPLARPVRLTKARRASTVRWLALAAIASTATAAAAVAGWTISRDVPPPQAVEATPRGANDRRPIPINSSSDEHLALDRLDTRERDLAEPPKVSDTATLAASATPAAGLKASHAGGSSSLEVDSALSLYREANQARRRGDVSRAIALFRRLQQAFPRSAEAHLSNVALGGALLESAAPREALLQFNRYLTASGAKNLAAEALYGRARALHAVGNRSEERAAWEQLQAEYPQSPYSATATRRLHSLE